MTSGDQLAMVDMANDDNVDVNLLLTHYEFLAEKLKSRSRYKKRKSLTWKTPLRTYGTLASSYPFSSKTNR